MRYAAPAALPASPTCPVASIAFGPAGSFRAGGRCDRLGRTDVRTRPEPSLTYRLLHIADLHLDRAFAAAGCHAELARRRRTGLRDALRLAGETAQAERCSAVTIAGDLYEHERSGVDTARFLAATFAAWRPLRVFIAPGNHDALMPGSLYRRTDWPDNVHVFEEPALAPVELEDGIVLWGLAHREPSWLGNPLDCAPAPSGDVHLALFHGSELGSRPEGKSIHGPLRAELLMRYNIFGGHPRHLTGVGRGPA